MATLSIRKGDLVQVISGKDRGVKGKVIEVMPESERILVEGVNRIKKHAKIGQDARGAKTGGIKGGLGLAEDKAEASIACRQTGPISFPKPLKRQDEMFSERISLIFKRLRVVRMVDARRNTLVYLTYTDRLIDGSPRSASPPWWRWPWALPRWR